MRHGALFNGIGGFQISAEMMEWDNVMHSEINSFCNEVVARRFPNSKNIGDVTTADFTIYRGRIDILTGGFPCQPYSTAGLRKGKADDRHLWPQMLRAVREIKPAWVVGENVPGIISWNGGLVFDEVQADLEAEGYEVLPVVLPACSVNAPHKRDRVWFVAHRTNTGAKNLQPRGENRVPEFGSSTNTAGIGRWEDSKRRLDEPRQLLQDSERQEGADIVIGAGQRRNAADADKLNRRRGTGRGNGSEVNYCGSQFTSHPDIDQRSERRLHTTEPKAAERYVSTTWHNFPTQSPIHIGDDGLFTESLRQRIREDSMGYLSEKEIDKILSKVLTEWREESIKASGNAIVPQVAYQIFKAIQHTTLCDK